MNSSGNSADFFSPPAVASAVVGVGDGMVLAQELGGNGFALYDPPSEGQSEREFPTAQPRADAGSTKTSSATSPTGSGLTTQALNGGSPQLQWNMCGALCNSGVTGPAQTFVINVVNRINAGNTPLALSLNEVCFDTQGSYVTSNLGSSGYTFARYTVLASTSTCGGGPFGIYIGWQNGCYGGSWPATCTFSKKYDAQTSTSGSHNGVICGHGAFPVYIPCSTHLRSGMSSLEMSTRVAQSREARAAVDYTNGLGTISYMAGDLNFGYGSSSTGGGDTPGWETNYDDSCSSYTCLRTFGSGGNKGSCPTDTAATSTHIDYVWIRTATQRFTAAPKSFSSSWSDHCMYEVFIAGR